MRNEFCTLFNERYLPRALALYRSLEETCPDFRLRAFCMDDASKEYLARIDLPHIVVIGLEELERFEPRLLEAKRHRTAVEYCWTATPVICLLSLAREPDLEGVTYLDADLLFWRDPAPIYGELGDGSILLVPHRYSDEFERCNVTEGTSEESGGIFNVQFVAFRRDDNGVEALQWWRERCLEWCFDRIEPGRYGDQKYLDDWPERFGGVRVLEHPGGGLAPWNVGRYRLGCESGSITVDDHPLVFHHYQSLRLHRPSATARLAARLTPAYRSTGDVVWTTGWRLSPAQLSLLWEPYVCRVAAAAAELAAAGAPGDVGLDRLTPGQVALQVVRRALPPSIRRALWRLRASCEQAGTLAAGCLSAAPNPEEHEPVGTAAGARQL